MITAEVAAALDQELFKTRPLEELMHIAGKIVADIIIEQTEEEDLCFVCGPGNNGGDGLVAAAIVASEQPTREISIICPKIKFEELLSSCKMHSNVQILESWDVLPEKAIIIDALFGFSEHLPLREPYNSIVEEFSQKKVISIDIPSGWNIDQDTASPVYTPIILISLTAPKYCSVVCKRNGTKCFVGGNFCPAELAEKYQISDVTRRYTSAEEDEYYLDDE